MTILRLLCGGAAQGLAQALAPAFEAADGCTIEAEFGAVGAMRARLLAGETCDIAILTRAMIADLAASGHVLAETIADLGPVETSVAVREGTPHPAIGDAVTLRAALLASDRLYFPDPTQATAGIHFFGVLERLGIRDALADRLATYRNGATAMRELANSAAKNPIGCTQATEILITPGIELVGPLPNGLGLAAVYTAAVTASSGVPETAGRLVTLLTGMEQAGARAEAGFSVGAG